VTDFRGLGLELLDRHRTDTEVIVVSNGAIIVRELVVCAGRKTNDFVRYSLEEFIDASTENANANPVLTHWNPPVA